VNQIELKLFLGNRNALERTTQRWMTVNVISYSHSSLPSSGTSMMHDDASLCVPRLVWLRSVSPPPASRWSGVSELRGSNNGAATDTRYIRCRSINLKHL